MASTTDIKNGAILKIDGGLWSVVEFQHVKPGKGGAFVRTKLRNEPPVRLSTAPSMLALRLRLLLLIVPTISISTRTAKTTSSWI